MIAAKCEHGRLLNSYCADCNALPDRPKANKDNIPVEQPMIPPISDKPRYPSDIPHAQDFYKFKLLEERCKELEERIADIREEAIRDISILVSRNEILAERIDYIVENFLKIDE